MEVIQGGKADFPITKSAPNGGDRDWLRELPEKTRFLSKYKLLKGSFLENYGVLSFSEKAALLYNFLPRMGDLTHIWVDTQQFSKDNLLIEILNPPLEEETNEHNLPVAEPRKEHDRHEGVDPDLPPSQW